MGSPSGFDGRHVIGAAAPASSGADDLRTQITLSRIHPDDVGERHVFVRLDRGPWMKLLFGEACTLEVAPGSHHLRIHNTLFWKNVHFTVEFGEHLEFLIINSGRWWTYGVAAVLGSAPLFLRVIQRSRV